LIDHHVTVAFGVGGDLSFERSILAQCRRGESGNLSTAHERLARVDDGGTGFRGGLPGDGSGLQLAAPRIGFFVRLRDPPRVGPIRRAARLARELAVERAGELDRTETLSAPASATLLGFGGTRILESSGLALKTMSAIEIQFHRQPHVLREV